MLNRAVPRSFSPWMVALPFLVLAGCGDDSPAGDGGGGSGDSPPLADARVYNPPNPAGLGPAPVELGLATDLAAPAAYVLLAKTGITNVTGSTITGGHLGVSPEVAAAITGFDLTGDPSTEFATSDSVVPPGQIYASNYGVPTPTNLTTAVLAMEAAYTDAAGRTNPDELDFRDGELGGETLAPGLYTFGTGVTIPENLTIAGSATDVWIFQIANDLDLSTNMQVVLTGGADARNVYWQVAGTVVIHADAHFEGVILSKTGITLQTNASMLGRAYAQTLIAIDDNAITAR